MLEYWCINSNMCTTSQIGLKWGDMLYLETNTQDRNFMNSLSLPMAGIRTRESGRMRNP